MCVPGLVGRSRVCGRLRTVRAAPTVAMTRLLLMVGSVMLTIVTITTEN